MTADDLPPAGQPMHRDGNELAGLLASVFVAEFTTLERRCRSCGDANAAGAHRSYHGAGVVLRCPTCDDLALRLAQQGDRVVFELFGTWTLREPGPPGTRGPV